MQRRGCEAIQVAISKYADSEATPAEVERVESHVAVCPECRAMLESIREVEAIFAATPVRAAEPSLRVGLYRQITLLKEEERRRERDTREARPWYVPAPHTPARRRGVRSPLVRLWSAASPLVAAAIVLFALLGLINLVGKNPPSETVREPESVAEEFPIQVPTIAAAIPSNSLIGAEGTSGDTAAPPPEATSKVVPAVFSPIAQGSATVYPTAEMAGVLVRLQQQTAVLEEGEVADRASWHEVVDPAYGYRAWYPPNWWSYSSGQSRYFYPWGPGGRTNAPYWIELRVDGNPHGLTAQTANEAIFSGNATLYSGQGGVQVLRYLSADTRNFYDDIYRYRPEGIYRLRAAVPRESALGDFQARMTEAEDVITGMSMRLRPVQAGRSAPSTGYAPVLFLNGSRLYSVVPGGRTWAITPPGYGVRQFALSPDMRTVAFSSAKNPDDAWARTLYAVDLAEDGTPASPRAVWEDGLVKVHDVAWYSDRSLVVIAQVNGEQTGIYRVEVTRGGGGNPEGDNGSVQRLVELDPTMAGARGLAVAPDRQLISFLAPVGESAGTDIYVLRPDGSNLQRLVSHSDPVAPSGPDGRVLAADNQAVKSYVWTDGRLEIGGYRFNILLTFGDASSPSLYRGGFLYSAPGSRSNDAILDHNTLGVADGTRMQVVHMAYSRQGKLALTGYYNDRDNRADKLAGLWVADIANGVLSNITALPAPSGSHGITDLQWAPDGRSLIYRETIPQSPDIPSARYDGRSPFRIVELDTQSGRSETLYAGD